MSSLKPQSEDYKSPVMTHAQSTWEEGMVTQQQLSAADSSVPQILDPLFYTSSLSSTDTKTNLSDDETSTNDRIFAFDGFFDVENMRSSSSVTTEELFSTARASSTSSYYLSPKTIQPVLLTTPSTSASTPNSQASPEISPSSPVTTLPEDSKVTKKQNGRKRKAESLEEKEARARERVLRNRHAAQMSRDKKRRQLADLEAQNVLLKEENSHLSKRVKLVEEENATLSVKLEAISAQLSEIRSQLAVSEVTKILLDGVRGSAASATLETNSPTLSDGKVEKISKNNNRIEKIIPQTSPRSFVDAKENSKKSQQRPVKMRSLYGTSTLQLPSYQSWMLQPRILKQLLLTFSIAFWTMTGQQKSCLRFSNKNKKMVFAKNDVVISDLVYRYNKKRWLRSVKVKRGRGASNLKLVPRDWRKYPP